MNNKLWNLTQCIPAPHNKHVLNYINNNNKIMVHACLLSLSDQVAKVGVSVSMALDYLWLVDATV